MACTFPFLGSLLPVAFRARVGGDPFFFCLVLPLFALGAMASEGDQGEYGDIMASVVRLRWAIRGGAPVPPPMMARGFVAVGRGFVPPLPLRPLTAFGSAVFPRASYSPRARRSPATVKVGPLMARLDPRLQQ